MRGVMPFVIFGVTLFVMRGVMLFVMRGRAGHLVCFHRTLRCALGFCSRRRKMRLARKPTRSAPL